MYIKSDIMSYVFDKNPDDEYWFWLSRLTNLNIIENNLDKPWDWDSMIYNPNLTITFIKKYSDKFSDWVRLLNRMKPIILGKSSRKAQDYVFRKLHKNADEYYEYWSWLSRLTTIDVVEKYIDKPWNWNSMSSNLNLTIDFIHKNIDKPWEWKAILKLFDINNILDF